MFTHPRSKVLKVPFSCCSFEDILHSLQIGISQKLQGYISITNTESLYHATKITSHFQYISNATFSCCDGVAVVLAGKMLGYTIPRLHGPDLMVKCCEFGVTRGWRHFFYGGKKGIPETITRNFATTFPGFKTVGCYSPPFRPLNFHEDDKIIEMINRAKPDILWVGLGLLKQERWIYEHLGKINVPWMIGVGAAFDFHAGSVKRAPKFYRDIGLEWLYRVISEPRMIRRNLYSALIFPEVIKGALKRRRNLKSKCN
jgi:N-acetylglucosaminyldiphosphoundecaprenol N-acetyl-beta-D-mannosaminyltransferase